MRRYRVIATQDSDVLSFQAEIQAWIPARSAWNWEPIHAWSTPVPDEPASVVAAIDHTLSAHGWELTKRPRSIDLPATLDVIPRDRVVIFESLAGQIRHLEDELERHQNALKNLVADVPPIHSPGYLGTSLLSKIVGLSRPQLYSYANQLRESLTAAYATASKRDQQEILAQLSEAEVKKIPASPDSQD